MEISLSSLRENFWFLGGRKAIRSVIKKFVICHRYESQAIRGASPSLPLNRVSDAAVFAIIGIDLTGSEYLKGLQNAWF